METGRKRGGVMIQSLARAFEILQYFQTETELGISEIAELMGLSKSTVHGLVNTLTAYNYLEQSAQTNKYRLGLKLFELGNIVQSRMDVRQEARPWCQILAEKYRTTVHLATHAEGELIYIDKVDTNHSSVVVYSQVGKRAPMHCTGVGKALLAYMPQEYLDRYIFSRPLEKVTKNTIDDKEGLIAELALVKERGYAIDNEEIEPGLHCIAAPIFDTRDSPTIALSVSFPYGRLWDVDWDEAVGNVCYYARQISERLGYMGRK